MHFSAMCRDYVDIAGRSAAKGHQTKEGWEKEAIFELNVSISGKQ